MEINKLNFDKKAATKITLFFVLAFGISYFLNLLSNPLASYGFKVNLNYAFGPFLAAILVGYLNKTPLKIKLFSENLWIRKIEFIGLVIFLIGSFVSTLKSGNTNYSLTIFGIILALLYTLLEELGWRVFLGNELSKYSLLTIFLVSTVLWFFWHYSFRDENLMTNPFQFLALIAGGSAGMAQFYRQTKSWMIVAVTHAVISVNLPTLIIFLVVTIGLLKFYETKIKQENKKPLLTSNHKIQD